MSPRDPVRDNDPPPVLVTGATGFLGAAIVRRLLSDGHRVIGIRRGPLRRVPTIARLASEGLELVTCDLLDGNPARGIIEAHTPVACIHAAWEVTPGRYLASPANERWRQASLSLARTLFRHGGRWFCGLGTCFENAPAASPLRRSAYVQAKLAVRDGLSDLAATMGGRACWLRVHQPFGPGEPDQRLLPTLLRTPREGGELTIRNGAAVRDFIHVEDIADALAACLEREIQGAFDLGTGRGLTIAEVERLVTGRVRPAEAITVGVDGGAADALVADAEPLRDATGWAARRALEGWLHGQTSRRYEGVSPLAGGDQAADDVEDRSGPRCPVCDGSSLAAVFAAADQPALLNRVYATADEARAAPRAQLDFRSCRRCGFIFNAAFDPALAVYGPGYVNDQSASATFRAHLDGVRHWLAALVAERPGRIVEIGCGQGTFLRRLCAGTARRGIGFDPACTASPAAGASPSIELRSQLFTHADARTLAADRDGVALVFCRHVLEHLPRPVEMLRLMRDVVAAHEAAVFVEVPGQDWIFRHDAFFDFFHEHCSLFGASSMSLALTRAGLRPWCLEPAFGGQYLLATGAAPDPAQDQTPRGQPRSRLNGDDGAGFTTVKDAMRNSLEEMRWEGPVLFWGAGAKAVSVLNHLALDTEGVLAVVDINPAKQGRYLPVTAHRVVAPAELPGLLAGRAGQATIVVMNPCYADEITRSVRSLGVHVRVRTLTDLARAPVHP